MSPLEGTLLPASMVANLYWGCFLLPLIVPAADKEGGPRRGVVLPGWGRGCTAVPGCASLKGFQQPDLRVPHSVMLGTGFLSTGGGRGLDHQSRLVRPQSSRSVPHIFVGSRLALSVGLMMMGGGAGKAEIHRAGGRLEI